MRPALKEIFNIKIVHQIPLFKQSYVSFIEKDNDSIAS